MEYDTEAAELKRQEICDLALTNAPLVQGIPSNELASILNEFARITPPEKPEIRFEFVTISSLNTVPKASSRKAGNVLLNWRKLVDVVPDISLAGLGALSLPVVPPAWAAILAGLYVWNKLWRGSEEEFSDIEALIMLALWRNRNTENRIGEQEGYEKANELRAQYQMPALTPGEYAHAINRLVEIQCIELVEGQIWLREWVQVKFR